MASQGLVAYVRSKYPSDDREDFLKKIDDSVKTWRDFARSLSAHEDDGQMVVTKSSTWAVCQEFLGNLKGEDLWYAQSRGGFWKCWEWNAQTNKCDQVSVRQVLTDIKSAFPDI